MKQILLGSLLAFSLSAVESEIQFENDHLRALKIKVEAHEEIGLHRDEYPQIVVSLKGGTITRIETDGSTQEVHFPKGVATYRDADPEGQLHKSVNNTCKPVELIVIQLKD